MGANASSDGSQDLATLGLNENSLFNVDDDVEGKIDLSSSPHQRGRSRSRDREMSAADDAAEGKIEDQLADFLPRSTEFDAAEGKIEDELALPPPVNDSDDESTESDDEDFLSLSPRRVRSRSRSRDRNAEAWRDAYFNRRRRRRSLSRDRDQGAHRHWRTFQHDGFIEHKNDTGESLAALNGAVV